MEETPIERFTAMCSDLILNFGTPWWERMRSLLFNDFAWVPPEDWKRISKWISINCEAQPPRLGRFHAAIAVLRIRKPESMKYVCPECKGAMGTRIFLRDKATSHKNSAWLQCSMCVVPKLIAKMGEEAFSRKVDEANERFDVITEEEFYHHEPVPVPAEGAIKKIGSFVPKVMTPPPSTEEIPF